MDVKCPQCGTVLTEGAKFCPKCGCVVPEKKVSEEHNGFCPHCGAPVEADAAFCGTCGKAISQAPGPEAGTGQNVQGAAPVQPVKASVGMPAVQSSGDVKEKVKDLFVTTGRLARGQFCLRIVFIMIFLAAIGLLSTMLQDVSVLGTIVAGIFIISFIAVSISYVMLSARRCHDLGKSGWMALVQFIPAVGAFFQIYLLCAKGNPGPNSYGEDPLAHS